MRSNTSFFHKGLSLNLLRRCWPLWAFWLVLLVLVFPVSVRSHIESLRDSAEQIAAQLPFTLFEHCCIAAKLSIFAGIAGVMAVFSFLYSSRTCGMINSFPVRRETVFITHYLTGLLPLLLAECLTALIAMGILSPWVSTELIGKWFAFAAMSTVAFYGFASLCAMLTGSLFILPLVFFVLNCTAVVVEESLRELLKIFFYGYAGSSSNTLMAFSPAVQVLRLEPLIRNGIWQPSEEPVILRQVWLPVYCIAGLVFSVLALLLYRKRQMETAGDTVAIPVLKPVFRSCMAFGAAIVCSSFITGEFLSRSLPADAQKVLASVLLLLGAFIGYFAAEMLMQKSIHVFGRKWRHLFAIWGILAAAIAFCILDGPGFETALPAPSEIDHITFGSYSSSVVREEGNIRDLCALHESFIRNEELHENSTDCMFFLRYSLKNGREMNRSYYLALDDSQKADPSSDVCRAQALLNTPEAILSRHSLDTEDTIYRCQIHTQFRENGSTFERSLPIQPEEAYRLYTEALLPDMEAGTIGCQYYFEEAAIEKLSDTHLTIEFIRTVNTRHSTQSDYLPVAVPDRYQSFTVQMDSANTIRWLRDNLGLEIKPMETIHQQ